MNITHTEQDKSNTKGRSFPTKPEWQILLEHLSFLEPTKLYRICRKMIIALQRMKSQEIAELLEQLNPTEETEQFVQDYGSNWPKPKGSPFNLFEILKKVFSIADNYFSDEEITKLLKQWIIQENLSFITIILEKRHSPLREVKDAIINYMKLTNSKNIQSSSERMGIAVGLIQRLLSENLNYINVAKNFISIEHFAELITTIIGPPNGNGMLGGKSAGLILAYKILQSNKSKSKYLDNVVTPRSWFITSDQMFSFVHFNALEEFFHTKYLSHDEIRMEYSFLEYIFKNSTFPQYAINSFKMILEDLKDKPLIIRSSSLLEDSFEAAFSGKYKSLFLSNTGTMEERLSALSNAVAEVYASIYGPDPIVYRKERGLLDFREEMGILIQEVVGNKIGKYYLPSFAGVAFSYNEFRWSPRLKRDDGIIRLVAGLGTRAVDRTMNDYPTLVSPGKPNIRVNTSVDETIRYSQQYVDVINLETNKFETIEFMSLVKETRGKIPSIEKIVSFNRHGALVEPVSSMVDFSKEDLIITFNNLIDRTEFIPQIKEILKTLKDSFGRPVDIEFAHDGKNLFLLQCRPQSSYTGERNIHVPGNLPDASKIFTANQYVNTGYIDEIEYVVYVDPFEYSSLPSTDDMVEVGKIISRLNRILPHRKFILIGPGRWGSKGDIKLGVPVIYSDINNTAMLIEVSRENEGYEPELSFGTHFFQDLVEANIKYLPLFPDKPGYLFNKKFFENTPNQLKELIPDSGKFNKVVKVYNVPESFNNKRVTVFMDGESCEAVACIRHTK